LLSVAAPKVVGYALLAQNLLDDIACSYEKLYGLLFWSDQAATGLFVFILAVSSIAIYFLGLPIIITAAGLYILRPPKYRDPLPTEPEAFFGRLTGVTSEELQRMVELYFATQGTFVANSEQ
jgi:hypothetical protein